MSRKLLFNLPRPTVPVFVRSSGVATDAAASAAVGGGAEASSSSSWIRSDADFPVRRIYCVGRNYREHALEMGGDPDREPPFFFQKPPDAVVSCVPGTKSVVPYPSETSNLHFEGELIVAMKGGGSKIPVDRALDGVYGYAVGCDLTRRDLQSVAKKTGRPWDASKGFDMSCPLSPIVPKEDVHLDESAELRLSVDGSERQKSTIGAMVYSVPEVISHLSRLFELKSGDLILTGTPAGVAELKVGDEVSIACGGLVPCQFSIGESN
ncbi:hypothetical protein ACHAWF_005678 [Thalassiosira exigua]